MPSEATAEAMQEFIATVMTDIVPTAMMAQGRRDRIMPKRVPSKPIDRESDASGCQSGYLID